MSKEINTPEQTLLGFNDKNLIMKRAHNQNEAQIWKNLFDILSRKIFYVEHFKAHYFKVRRSVYVRILRCWWFFFLRSSQFDQKN